MKAHQKYLDENQHRQYFSVFVFAFTTVIVVSFIIVIISFSIIIFVY